MTVSNKAAPPMGTWGPGPLDGDDALDLLDEFERNPTAQLVDDTLILFHFRRLVRAVPDRDVSEI